MSTKSVLEELVPEELYEAFQNSDVVNYVLRLSAARDVSRERALIQCVLSLVEQTENYKKAYTEAMKLSPGRPIIIYRDPDKTDADL